MGGVILGLGWFHVALKSDPDGAGDDSNAQDVTSRTFELWALVGQAHTIVCGAGNLGGTFAVSARRTGW